MIKSSEPIFEVADVRRAVRFYVDVIGFGGEWFWGEGPDFGGVNWAGTAVLFSRDALRTGESKGVFHFFRVEDVNGLYEKHRAAGATIVSPPTNKPWGLCEYAVRDPDNHVLRFAGPSEFVKPATAIESIPESIRIEKRLPTPAEYDSLKQSVGWQVGGAELLSACAAGVVAIDTISNQAVGTARLMHDGVGWYSMWDVIVRPEFQAHRIGTAMVETLVDFVRQNAPHGANIHLFTYSPKFYERLGFKTEQAMLLRTGAQP